MLTQREIALNLINAKSHPWGLQPKNPLPPLVTDDHVLDSRRAQSHIVDDLVADLLKREKAHKAS